MNNKIALPAILTSFILFSCGKNNRLIEEPDSCPPITLLTNWIKRLSFLRMAGLPKYRPVPVGWLKTSENSPMCITISPHLKMGKGQCTITNMKTRQILLSEDR